MKGIKLILIVAMVALALTLSLVSQKAYAADNIAYLVPAESGVVETGGGEIPAVLMAPTKFECDAPIHLLLPAKTVVAEAGGGEIPAVLMAPTKFENECIYLLPAAN